MYPVLNINPTRVQLELTEKCNLNCLFCYNSLIHVQEDKILQILRRLKEEKVFEVILTGGEPLIHPKIKDIIRFSSQNFRTMIQSNGIVLSDDEMISLIVECTVESVSISIHGPERIHDYLTGVNGSYAQSISALQKILKTNIRTSVNLVAVSINVEQIYEILREFQALGLHELTITRFVPSGKAAQNPYLATNCEQFIRVLEKIYEFENNFQYPKVTIANAVPYCIIQNEELCKYVNYCNYGYDRFYIDPNGNVMICGMLRKPLGNILTHTFNAIKKESSVLQKYLTGKNLPIKCVSCESLDLCHGGCRAAAYNTFNHINAVDPFMKERIF